jgi:hypothetical protein
VARSLERAGFVAVGLLTASACGGSVRTGANGVGGADAADGAAESGGTAGASADGGGATGGATGDATDDVAFGGAGGFGGACAVPPGEELGPVEVVAKGQQDPEGIGTAGAGPVWAHGYGDLTVPGQPTITFINLSIDGVDTLVTSGGWFATEYEFVRGLGVGVTVGRMSGPASDLCYYDGPLQIAIDSSYVYGLNSGAASQIARLRLSGSCSSSEALVEHIICQVPYPSPAMAVDDSRVYFFALTGSTEADNRRYSVLACAKAGGAPTALASAVDPEQTQPLAYTFASLVADRGALAWSLAVTEAGVTHYVWVLPPGAATPRAVTEPGGVAVVEGEYLSSLVIALDDHYVYWVTLNGQIKRDCITGGAPEVIAENQDRPSAIAVDDAGVYWLTATKVMEMKKLGAPGNDAGPDASLDATTSDAGADVTLEASDAAE